MRLFWAGQVEASVNGLVMCRSSRLTGRSGDFERVAFPVNDPGIVA